MRFVKDQHHPHCGYALKMGLMDNWWRWLFSGIVRTFKERRTHPRTALSMSVLGSLECRLFWHRPPLIFLFNLILGNISSIVIIMRFPTETWVMTKSGAQKLWEKGKIALLSETQLQRIWTLHTCQDIAQWKAAEIGEGNFNDDHNIKFSSTCHRSGRFNWLSSGQICINIAFKLMLNAIRCQVDVTNQESFAMLRLIFRFPPFQ